MPLYLDSDSHSFAGRVFDYVIVGGGTAGLALAARLSEDSSISVAVIEAGDDAADLPAITIPGLFGGLMMHEKHDWNMLTVPQEFSNNKVLIQPRGKVLGGSSASNFLLTGRANAEEYDGFEKLGNNGWSWLEFLKYFKKSETLIYPSKEYSEKHGIMLDPKWHGVDGPIKKSFGPWITNTREPYVEALNALGLPINPDPASGDNYGVNIGLSSVDPNTRTRSYSPTAYFIPNSDRKNLSILTKTLATRVVLETSENRTVAIGVEIFSNNRTFVVKARREVILCAGGIKSPQLLELSGIGQRSVLEKYGIKQVVDLPVGENLQVIVNSIATTHKMTFSKDHYNVPVVFEQDTKYDTATMDEAELAIQTELYKTQQIGKLSSAPQVVSWIPLEHIAEKDAQAHLNQLFKNEENEFRKDHKEGIFDLFSHWLNGSRHAQIELIHVPAMFPGAGTPLPGKKYQTLLLTQVHPLSRGSVHIQSADPKVSPAIDPSHYKARFDLELTVNAVKFARKLAKTQPFASTIVEEFAPGPEVTSDEQLIEYCKNRLTSMYHAVGSVSMLPREQGGVVDSNLLVYGTTNLRVVDASIIPFQLSCHMQSTVYAIAEKAADIIKAVRV